MFDELADSTLAVVFVKDAEGRYTFINRGYELVYRVARTTYLGKTDFDVFPKDTARRYRESDRRVMESRSPAIDEERQTYADGSHRVVVIKFPLADSTGDVYGVCGVAVDITQRIEAETRMRMLSSAVDRASDMIAMFEWTPLGEWRIFYVNDMFLKMTGYDRSEVIGHTSRFLEGPRTNVEESDRRRKLLSQGIPCRADVAYYRRDGSIFWMELNARPLRGPDGAVTHTIVLYRDITERRAAQERRTLDNVTDSKGLYDSVYFARAVEEAIDDARANSRVHSIVTFQIEGDVDFHALSEAIDRRLRSIDVIARTAQHEMSVLLRYCSKAQAQRVCSECLDTVRDVSATATAGVTQIDSATADAESAIEDARSAGVEAVQ